MRRVKKGNQNTKSLAYTLSLVRPILEYGAVLQFIKLLVLSLEGGGLWCQTGYIPFWQHWFSVVSQ
jgi:hypothetical protein